MLLGRPPSDASMPIAAIFRLMRVTAPTEAMTRLRVIHGSRCMGSVGQPSGLSTVLTHKNAAAPRGPRKNLEDGFMLEPSASPLSATSATLLQQLRDNSEDGWRRLVEIYGPVVYRWCRHAKLGEEDSADIVQEVFRSVMLHFDRFRREQPSDSFRAWLVTITRNKVRDHFRRATTQPPLADGSAIQEQLAQTVDPHVDDSQIGELPDDRHLVLQGALTALKSEIEPRTWTIFWRTTVEGHSAADIAREFDMTPKAVRQAKYRVLQRLREELKDLEPPSSSLSPS